IKGTCDMYLDELRKELEALTGKKVSDSTVWRALRRSGYTMKKVCPSLAQRTHILISSPVRKAFFIRGKRYVFMHLRSFYAHSFISFSILPALSIDGFLFASIVEGSFNTALFTEFIEVLLEHMNPFPEPNSVIVMDNCRIHKSPLIVEMIEQR
ncbi:hypothetical protein SCHPADRAFT_822917, partial [Schizopora paradoxa]